MNLRVKQKKIDTSFVVIHTEKEGSKMNVAFFLPNLLE